MCQHHLMVCAVFLHISDVHTLRLHPKSVTVHLLFQKRNCFHIRNRIQIILGVHIKTMFIQTSSHFFQQFRAVSSSMHINVNFAADFLKCIYFPILFSRKFMVHLTHHFTGSIVKTMVVIHHQIDLCRLKIYKQFL